MMRKLFYVATLIVIVLVGFLGVTYSYEYNDDSFFKFELIGPYELYLDVNSEYKEYGIKVIKNGYDVSSNVKIDSSLVNMNRIGEYKVKYEIDTAEYTEYIYRIVKVIDNIAPIIELNGDDIVYVQLGEEYREFGCIVSDNYDSNLDNKVIVSSNLNSSEIGEYVISYSVSDSSGNESSVSRVIKVINDEIEKEN